jgi:hypothetical protein
MLCFLPSYTLAQQLTREQWGAPEVKVTQANEKWTIAGKRNTVTLNESDLALRVKAGDAVWQMVPSSANDLRVRSKGIDSDLRLAGATKKTITRYDTGFKTGVKIVLNGWKPVRVGDLSADETSALPTLDLTLVLTVALEGKDEELVFDAVASEHEAVVRQLDWPAALDAREVDYTLLSNGRGTLLPRTWPKEYYPIRSITPEGKIAATDHSLLQSNVIESWSMSWWGFQKGKSAMMIIVETPDDAAYQFSHPAGGPTVIGPRWLATLGRFGYPRSARTSFFSDGNYVDMAKRYRRYELGYPYILHDQYRDYYLDAPSYDAQFAVREEDEKVPAQAFPGSRFGDSKDGGIPMMRHWDGGRQAYLNNRFWLGHLLKNYQLFFDHGITPQGIYLDVIGYVEQALRKLCE